MSKKKNNNKNTPTKLTKKQAIYKLWEMGDLTYLLRGVQREMRDAVYNSIGKKTVFLASRRLGKCLEENTKVMTTKGMKNIQDVKVGDMVYGWEKDGSIKPTKVLDVVYQGEKTVVDITSGGRVLASATEEHPWLTYEPKRKNKYKEQTTKELLTNAKYGNKIARYFVSSPCGDVYEPHAYTIGALLGDGCSRERGNQIKLSSENYLIPKKCSEEINAIFYKTSGDNYTWALSYNEKLDGAGNVYRLKNKEVVHCNHYESWCKGRYAHEKTVDLDVIKSWDRDSCLRFMAGLLDTDGSIRRQNNELIIYFGCQAKPVVEAFKYLFYQLFQYDPNLALENRDKYVNGGIWYCSIKNNLINKRALKELDKYIQTKRKKWKDEYSELKENNSNPDFIGVKRGNSRDKVRCWDLSVANESKLYLLANGLVTHNTFTMCTIAVEFCIKKPNQIVKLIFPKKKDAEAVAKYQMRDIFKDCPPHMMPEYKEAKKLYIFPNGSEIQMAGTDNGSAESVRGSASHLILLDEAGFHNYNEFEYIVQSILMPTLLTTKGKMILASTPSKEPDHPFLTQYVAEARASDQLIEFDIYANPMITADMIDDIADEYPLGKEDPAFKREFLLISQADNDMMVVPEFTKEVKQDIVKHSDLPPHYDAYVSGDPAVRDLTGILFGYYDFLKNKLVIMDELVMGGKGQKQLTTDDIASGIQRKERMLFQNELTGEVKEPYLRIMDNNNLILINDLYVEHGLRFIPTKKDGKREQVNKLRMMLKKGLIEIDPKCKTLLHHLATTRWKKLQNGTLTDKFDHSKAVHGKFQAHHGDLVDALIYMVRNVKFSKNPYPDDWNMMSGEDVYQSRYRKNNELEETFKDIMNIKKRK